MGRQVSGCLFFLASHTVHPCPVTVRIDRANECGTYHPGEVFLVARYHHPRPLVCVSLRNGLNRRKPFADREKKAGGGLVMSEQKKRGTPGGGGRECP